MDDSAVQVTAATNAPGGLMYEVLALPTHPHMIDPRTGMPLTAVGVLPSGRVVWPVMGAADDDPDDKPDDDKKDDPDDKPDDDKKDRSPDELKAELARTRREAAKYRVEAKEKSSKLKEYEDRDKSEQQKAAEKAADAEKRAGDAELKALRLEVAFDKGLTPAQARRLAGSTKEELQADADELLELFGGESKDGDVKKPPTSRPRERLRGGGDPDDEPEETDPDKILAKVPRRY